MLNTIVYKTIIEEIKAGGCSLVVVTKNQSLEDILKIYELGHKDFGENRPQELIKKYNALPKDINWHLIGHLQSNKVKNVVPIVKMIHSVDSFSLAYEINKQCAKSNKDLSLLIQIKLSDEETKHGFIFQDLVSSLKSDDWQLLTNIRICGVMGIGSLTNDVNISRQEFKKLKLYYDTLKKQFLPNATFSEISMGMSFDYKVAMEEGSTIVRIGSLLFQ